MKKGFGVGKMVDGELRFTNSEGEQVILLKKKTTTTTTTTVVEVVEETLVLPNLSSSFVYDEKGDWDIPVFRRKK